MDQENWFKVAKFFYKANVGKEKTTKKRKKIEEIKKELETQRYEKKETK